jgi:two-component system sensor histidine kinase/response regulator
MKATDGPPLVTLPPMQPAPAPQKQTLWLRLGRVCLALLPLVFLVSIGGYGFLKARQSIREEIQQNLTSIAEEKKILIEHWLSGILQDAALFSDHTHFSGMIEQWLRSGKGDHALENSIRVRLGQILQSRHYSGLAVFDTQGRPVLNLGEAGVEEHSLLARQAIREGKPQFVDLHGNPGGQIELGVLAPLIGTAGQAVGALYLAVDAEDYLYPLLQAWPVSHETAETVLVRRVGEEIEFISPLRLINVPALAKRVPLDTARFPSSAGVRGFRGIYQDGIDYRGKEVLSHLTSVEGTPWVLFAEIDKDEAYLRIHRLGKFFGSAFVITLLASYWLVWLVWRNQGLHHRLVVAVAEQALRQGEDRYRLLVENMKDVIWVMDTQTMRYLYVSPSARQLFGHTAEELASLPALQNFPPTTRTHLQGLVDDRVQAVLAGQADPNRYFTDEIQVFNKEGSLVWVEIVSHCQINEETGHVEILGVTRDISQRKRIKAELNALNAELENRILERTAELQSVLDTTQDGFDVADSTGRLLKVNPAACRMLGYSEEELLKLTISDIETQENPAQTQAHIEKIMREGVDLFETRLRRKDGQIIDAEISVIYNKNQGGMFYTFFRNVTSRKRLEAELRETSDRLSIATAAGDIGIWDWWLEDDRMLWDERMYTLYGIGAGDFTSAYDSWVHALHPDDRQRAEDEIKQALSGQAEFRTEFRIIWPDGSVHHIMAFARVIRNEGGSPVRMVGVNLDVTNRVLAEDKLRASEARLDFALQNSQIGAWEMDLRDHSTQRTLLHDAIYGYGTLLPHWSYDTFLEHVLPEDRPRVDRTFQQAIAAKSDWRFEFRIRGGDGGERWGYGGGGHLFDADGESMRVSGIVQDITDRKRAETEKLSLMAILQEREETFRRLFQDSLEPAMLMRDKQFIECNQAALDLLRLCKEEFIGLTHTEISPECQEDGRNSAAKAEELIGIVTRGEGRRFDWHCLRKDGSDFFVEVSLTPITIGGEPLLYCSWREITERKHLTETLAVAKNAAEAANRAKSAFLANMSHEIRTPLNSILAKAHLIKTQGLGGKAAGQIEAICQAAHHLLCIVNDILDLSKIEAGKLSLETADFPVAEKIEGIVNLLNDRAVESGVALRIEIDPSLPPILRGDKLRIRQMLLNLVGNAVKFTEQGAVTVRVLRVGPGEEHFLVRFEVQDTGKGIAPEDQKRLFNDFEQADNRSTRQYGGTGLGLAICKRLAEQMGGSIGVSSEAGIGSIFWFAIPLDKGSQASMRQDQGPSTEELALRLAQGHRDARVLLVEDNVTNQEIAVELLQEVGIAVDLAANGEEALDMAAAHSYDLILMDIQMPKMDGLEATLAIRRLPGQAHVPIVALTANAYTEEVARYITAGMNGHIAKPIVVNHLYETMLKWLDAKGAALPNAVESTANEVGEAKLALPFQASLDIPSPNSTVSAEGASGNHPPIENGEGEIAWAAAASQPADGLLARLAEIPGLDTQLGINRLAGKPASYIRLLRKFAERQPAEMAALRQALADGDLHSAKRVAHTLKGLAATMGATLLQSSSQRLEVSIRENLSVDEIDRLSKIVATEYAVLAESIVAAMSDVTR